MSRATKTPFPKTEVLQAITPAMQDFRLTLKWLRWKRPTSFIENWSELSLSTKSFWALFASISTRARKTVCPCTLRPSPSHSERAKAQPGLTSPPKYMKTLCSFESRFTNISLKSIKREDKKLGFCHSLSGSMTTFTNDSLGQTDSSLMRMKRVSFTQWLKSPRLCLNQSSRFNTTYHFRNLVSIRTTRKSSFGTTASSPCSNLRTWEALFTWSRIYGKRFSIRNRWCWTKSM